MIENEKQLEITKKHLLDFENALKDLQSMGDVDDLYDISPLLKEFYISGVKAKIADFKAEIEEYTNK